MTSIAKIVFEKYSGISKSGLKEPLHTAPKKPIVLTEEQLEAKETILEMLRSGVVRISFVKMDGTNATMECTLNPELIPVESRPSSTSAKVPRVYPQHTIRAYATDRQGWRSFSVPNVFNATLLFE